MTGRRMRLSSFWSISWGTCTCLYTLLDGTEVGIRIGFFGVVDKRVCYSFLKLIVFLFISITTIDLHSLWDGLLIAKAIRTVPRNYSRPLPYPDVEQALRGTIYDSYIRRIMWEGVFQKWSDQVPEWFSCPENLPPAAAAGIWQQVVMGWKRLSGGGKQGVEIGLDTDVICPYHWAKPIHALNCDVVWPKELDEPPYGGGSLFVRLFSSFICHLHLKNVTRRTRTMGRKTLLVAHQSPTRPF